MNKTNPKVFRSLVFPVTISLILATLGMLAVPFSASQIARAAPPGQIPIYTPTPGPDGRIIYVVQPNDTLMSIYLLTGVPIEKLRELNDLSGDTIYEGQKLLLGMAGPLEVTFTPGPTPTPTAILPTPSPLPGEGTLCIILFEDINGNSLREGSEPSLPNGAISYANRGGNISKSVDTGAGEEYQCFEDLPEGYYTISVAIPDGYNITTTTDYETELKAGTFTYVAFGAQANSQTEASSGVVPAEGERSPLLGIIGLVLLLAGAVVAFYAFRVLRVK